MGRTDDERRTLKMTKMMAVAWRRVTEPEKAHTMETNK